MPRAPSGLALLLMAGLAFAATPPLDLVTSWLSTSDLQWAVCSTGADPGPLCPPPCPANSTKSTQCLYYLQESHKEEVCGPDLGPERRRDVLHGLRMRHCCEHAVDQALPEAAFHGGPACRHLLDALIMTDDLARRVSCGHAQVLTRYDCAQTYSIAHRCHHCKVHATFFFRASRTCCCPPSAAEAAWPTRRTELPLSGISGSLRDRSASTRSGESAIFRRPTCGKTAVMTLD
ncbi:hypothetical protein BDFB_011231 [Asbolus verrucosus]|uniref:Uncharacterized protein n=1 Tax=Asbolus verrucosus TaxID=1661398 RepID=A0A482V9E5_ASBVE|nr:hypothetical protein BDFB_011231 [Asbolus verrucosus]